MLQRQRAHAHATGTPVVQASVRAKSSDRGIRVNHEKFAAANTRWGGRTISYDEATPPAPSPRMAHSALLLLDGNLCHLARCQPAATAHVPAAPRQCRLLSPTRSRRTDTTGRRPLVHVYLVLHPAAHQAAPANGRYARFVYKKRRNQRGENPQNEVFSSGVAQSWGRRKPAD